MPQSTGEAAGTSDRAKRYILVVSGSADDLYRTSMLLQRFAYPVYTAQTAKQALEIVSVNTPSLVIADLELPDMTGINMVRKLGSEARVLPFILLLPHADADVDSRNVEIGGSMPCLAKPVQAEELFRLVQAAIEPTPRSTIRVTTHLPVVLNKVLLDIQKGEYALDLSEEGLYIRTLKPLRKGEQISAQFRVSDREVRVEGTVIYVHRPSEGVFREPGMAVRFERIAAEDREAIRQFIRGQVTDGIEGAKG